MEKQLRWAALILLLWASLCQGTYAGDVHYLGPKTCALCHKEIAAKQQQTAMANTWQGRLASWLPPSFDVSVDDDYPYAMKSIGGRLSYSVTFPGRPKLSLPVEILMGGKRHGLGFLIPVSQVDEVPLARPVLLQARYAWSPEKNKLLLSPGCAATRPQTLESVLGLVLSPTFESRCLACHGQPGVRGTGNEGGVHCESCHGPGSEHLVALGRGKSTEGIVNPKRLSNEESMAVCAQCHVGLAKFSDPSPDDLLIANQVRAIRNSECFLQSGKAFSCTTCHDPHSDAAVDDRRALNACLGCHAVSAKPHAAICPVNAKSNCIGCHMPSVEKGPLHLVDHLIRVHPEQKIHANGYSPDLRSQVTPRAEYLRMIATNSADTARAARDRIAKGASFYTVARAFSVDNTAAIGGYLGRKTIADLGGALAREAEHLRYGDTSDVVQSGQGWMVLQRLPREFRWDSEQLEHEAEDLAARGDAADSIGKAQHALMIYPEFLRALNLIGITFAKSGNPKKGADVLRVAERLYPNDAGTEFTLGSALELTGDQTGATVAYQRTVALEPDFVAAYVNLGMISYAAGDWMGAIRSFREGLQIDPMCAELYHDLGLALTRDGDASGAKQAMELAGKLDPQFLSTGPDNAGRPGRSGSF